MLYVRGPEVLAASPSFYDSALLASAIPHQTEPTVEQTSEEPNKECFCVRYIRETFGVPIRGDASTLESNMTLANAQKGDVVILKYGTVFHASYFLQVFPGGMWVSERILLQGKCITRERLIEWKDKAIYGFYRHKI